MLDLQRGGARELHVSREQEVEEVKKVRGKEERFVKEFLWKCCERGVIIEEEFNK